MAEGTYKLIKKNSEGTYDEKEVQAESGKVLGFDSGLDPVMVDPGTSGDSVTDVFVEQDPQFPIEYLKYTKDGVDYDVTAIAKANGLIWGGFVSWVGLLIFSVTPALYYLFAVLYKILETTIITLDAADPDNSRIDVIAVDNTSSVIVIKGTPAANPQKPSIDPETQIELTYVLIPAGATEPENIDQSIIYDENTEWTGAGSGVTVDFDNATSPFHLSKCASVGSIDNNDTVTFTTGVPVDVTDFKNLILYLKLKATMSSRHNLYAAWMRSGVLVSNEVVLPVSKSNVTTWQSIAIQLTSFTWSQSTVDTLRLRWSKSGPNVSHDGFYLDFVKLETGIIQQVVNSAIILTGDITGSGITGSPVPTTLATVNSNVGQFGDATNIPKVTVDGKGRVTAVENVAVTIPATITPTSDATPVDTDEVVSLRGTSWLKTTWTVLKAFLKTYFDNVYSAINHTHTFSDEKVKYNASDSAAGYLADKIVAGTNITLEEGTGGDADKLKISAAGGCATTFLALTDTPAAYTGQAGKYPKVNAGENGLEFDIPGAGDFALKALSNLASVAINTSLISDTDSTDDLGSSTKYWANLYVKTIYTPVINGGADVNGDITIQGTTNATRETSYVNLQPNGGNVGIKTSSPLCRLDLGASLTTNSLFKAGTFEIGSYATNNGWLVDNAYFDGAAFKYRANGYACSTTFLNGTFQVRTAPSGLEGDALSYSCRLCVDNTGNVAFGGTMPQWGDFSGATMVALATGEVGIGKTVPTARLHVVGANALVTSFAANISGSSGTGLVVANNNTVGISTTTPVTRLDLGASLTNNSLFKAGTFEIQSYAINNGFLADNGFWDGSRIQYRANGYVVLMQFLNGGLNIGTAPSGTAGAGATYTYRFYLLNTGNIGFGVASPKAVLHLKAGTATASTSPLKFTSGTLLGTPEAGAVEFLTDNLHITISTGSARKGIMLDDGARLTSGKIPIATTNGRLVDGQTPLSGTKVYYVADSSGGSVTRKLTFIDGILTAET